MREDAFDLSTAAIIASGAGEHELDAYLGRIDALCRRAQPHLAQAGDRERAGALFRWLWQTRPDRYLYHGNFRLTRALRAQLGETPGPVGNCLGLTLLYNVLAQRLGLRVRACHLEEAFGRGPHVFSIVDTADGPVDVENIFPDGFDYRGHRDNPERQEWGDRELVADVYHSAAGELFETGDLPGAVALYDKAIALNPGYSTYLNKGMALCLLGRTQEAERWLGRGVRLSQMGGPLRRRADQSCRTHHQSSAGGPFSHFILILSSVLTGTC